jgi:hypothetical protein
VRYSRHDKIDTLLQLAWAANVCFTALVHGVAALWPARVEMMRRVLGAVKDEVKRISFLRM